MLSYADPAYGMHSRPSALSDAGARDLLARKPSPGGPPATRRKSSRRNLLFLAEHLDRPSEVGLGDASLYRSRVALTASGASDGMPGLGGDGRRRGGPQRLSHPVRIVTVALRWPADGPPWSRLPGRCPLAPTVAISVQPARVLGFALRSIDRAGDDRAIRSMPAAPPRMLRGEAVASLGGSLAEGSRRQASQPDPDGAGPEPPSSDGMHDQGLFAAGAGSRAKELA